MADVVIKRPELNRFARLRRTLGAAITDGLFEGIAQSTRLLPIAQPEAHGIEVIRDVRYRDGTGPYGLADIWRPKGAKGPLPVALYIHGGRFARLSKDTHWIFNLIFARKNPSVLLS